MAIDTFSIPGFDIGVVFFFSFEIMGRYIAEGRGRLRKGGMITGKALFWMTFSNESSGGMARLCFCVRST